VLPDFMPVLMCETLRQRAPIVKRVRR